jgi:hypothetical protein
MAIIGRVVPARSPYWRLGATVSLAAAVVLAAVAGSRYLVPILSNLRGESAQTSERSHVLGAFAQLPLSFEPNQGQADNRVKFVSRRSNFTIFLTRDGATLSMHGATPALGGTGSSLNPRAALRYIGNQKRERSDNVSFKFTGASPAAKIKGADKLQTVTNYLIGSDPAKWHSSIPNYTKVKYESIYPGVDLVFYGNYGRLEYDIDVAPGVDPQVIQMEFDDAQGIKLNGAGDLLLHAGKNQVALGRPIAYQEGNGARRAVAAKYVLHGSSEVTIALGDYDRKKPLTIDPAIMYSTYIGGTMAQGQAVAVDASGSAYLTGWTCCVNDFPKASGYQGNLTGIDNAFVAKFSADGKSLVYSTYLGGSQIDIATGIAVDSKGDAYVTGFTNSTNFPTAPSQGTALTGGFDAFVTELNPNGNGLIYSRYLGGSADDVASAIAVDATGLAYVTGQTFSTDFPTTASAYQQNNPSSGAIGAGFLARIDPPANSGSDSQLYYATYFGGQSPGGNALLTGAAIGGPPGNVYVVGGGGIAVPVTTGVPFGGTFDAVVADFDTTQSGKSSVLFSEFIGGSGFDTATGVATQLGCTVNCPAFISGYTFSADLDLLGARATIGGWDDAFIAKVDPHGGLNYINYVGGSGFDEASGAAVDSKGDELVVGVTFRGADLLGPITEILQQPPSATGALFTSSNGGASFAASSWSSAKAGSITFNGLAIDKSVTPSIIYAGTDQNGFWRSPDGGLTFFQSAAFGAGVKISAVAVETGIGGGPKTVYVAAGSTIWISTDAGQTFVQGGAIPFPGPVNVYFIGSEEPVPGSNNPDFFVFLGTDHGFFVSTNAGQSYSAATGLTIGKQKTQVFSGVRDTTTTSYYIGTDKGVFVSTNDGAAFTPTNLNSNAVLSMAVDTSTTPSTVYAATYGNGVIASTDGFNTKFTYGETAPSSNLNYVAVDDETTNPAIVYAGAGDNLAFGTVWRSADAGNTYTQLDPGSFNQPCCIFPLSVNSGEIFAGNYREADAFIAKMAPQGSFIAGSSVLGGSNYDSALGVAVDSSDNAYVGGLTFSPDFPEINAEQASMGAGGSGVVNAFVTKVGYTSSAKLTITPAINFGTQILRTPSRPRIATVTNTSKTESVALGDIRISGVRADDFQIMSGNNPPASARSKKAAAVPPCGPTLAPKSKCEITIEFTPLELEKGEQVGLLVPTNGIVNPKTNTSTLASLILGASKRPR